VPVPTLKFFAGFADERHRTHVSRGAGSTIRGGSAVADSLAGRCVFLRDAADGRGPTGRMAIVSVRRRHGMAHSGRRDHFVIWFRAEDGPILVHADGRALVCLGVALRPGVRVGLARRGAKGSGSVDGGSGVARGGPGAGPFVTAGSGSGRWTGGNS